jgi:lipopolysaccharide export system permease protein
MLALPFALGRRRGHRAYRFGVALAIVVAFNEVINQGALVSRLNGASPYLTMWLPFALLLTFSTWRYYNTCYRLRPDRLEPFIERTSDMVRRQKQRLAGLVGWGAA